MNGAATSASRALRPTKTGLGRRGRLCAPAAGTPTSSGGGTTPGASSTVRDWMWTPPYTVPAATDRSPVVVLATAGLSAGGPGCGLLPLLHGQRGMSGASVADV